MEQNIPPRPVMPVDDCLLAQRVPEYIVGGLDPDLPMVGKYYRLAVNLDHVNQYIVVGYFDTKAEAHAECRRLNAEMKLKHDNIKASISEGLSHYAKRIDEWDKKYGDK